MIPGNKKPVMLLKGQEEDGPRWAVVLHLSLLIHVVLIVCSSGGGVGDGGLGSAEPMSKAAISSLPLMFLIRLCTQAKRMMEEQLDVVRAPEKPTQTQIQEIFQKWL